MTRPWVTAEIAGAKALYMHIRGASDFPNESSSRISELYLLGARTVLDAAGAAPSPPPLDELFRASWDASSGDDLASKAARQSLLALPGAPDLKSESPLQDLEKARWYIEREIDRLRNLKANR